MSLGRFSNFTILEKFVTDFSGTMKVRKLKVCINMDNDSMYCVYQNKGQGHITLGVMSFDRFSKFKMHFTYKLLCLWLYFNEPFTTLGL